MLCAVSDTGTQVNNSTFIFIADKVFGFPVKADSVWCYERALKWRRSGYDRVGCLGRAPLSCLA